MVEWVHQIGTDGKPDPKAIPTSKMVCVINGKANIMNKHFMTPKGAVTMVTEEQLKRLEGIPQFKQFVDGGFLTVEKKKVEAEEVAKNMKPKDKSAPLTPKTAKGKTGKAE